MLLQRIEIVCSACGNTLYEGLSGFSILELYCQCQTQGGAGGMGSIRFIKDNVEALRGLVANLDFRFEELKVVSDQDLKSEEIKAALDVGRLVLKALGIRLNPDEQIVLYELLKHEADGLWRKAIRDSEILGGSPFQKAVHMTKTITAAHGKDHGARES